LLKSEYICSHIAERVLTYGDVGTPVLELRNEFSPLKGCFGDVKDGAWWHGGSKNCQEKGVFHEKESSPQFKVWTTDAGSSGASIRVT
jgi:hypothetical protein